ncbi:hypothetical protein TNCV_2764761 [Trichonephila clavipes]|nr:hypothetical protein TNCV_2764761 [Trichonephila clavipes]
MVLFRNLSLLVFNEELQKQKEKNVPLTSSVINPMLYDPDLSYLPESNRSHHLDCEKSPIHFSKNHCPSTVYINRWKIVAVYCDWTPSQRWPIHSTSCIPFKVDNPWYRLEERKEHRNSSMESYPLHQACQTHTMLQATWSILL